jgi:hypothetical protein
MGFSRKDHAKRLLETHFTEGTDYKILLLILGEQVSATTNGLENSRTENLRQHGGHNKEQVPAKQPYV